MPLSVWWYITSPLPSQPTLNHWLCSLVHVVGILWILRYYLARKSATKRYIYISQIYFLCISFHVVVLDGDSEIDAHINSKLANMICLRHWFMSLIIFFLQKRPVSLHACTTCSELPSTMDNANLLTYNNWCNVQSIYHLYLWQSLIRFDI